MQVNRLHFLHFLHFLHLRCGSWEWYTQPLQCCREHDWPDLDTRKKSYVSSLLCFAARSTKQLHAYSGVPKNLWLLQKSPSPEHWGKTCSLKFTLTLWQNCCFPNCSLSSVLLALAWFRHTSCSWIICISQHPCSQADSSAWLKLIFHDSFLKEKKKKKRKKPSFLLLFLDYGTVSDDPGLISASTDTCH